MKKILFAICTMTLALSTFWSCSDVPSPYDRPEKPDGPTVIVPTGDGTATNPYNVAALDSLFDYSVIPTEKIYAKGIVSSVQSIDVSYGNAIYYISDDGKTTKQFEIYRGYSLNGQKFTSEDEIEEGDTVVVFGTVVLYNNTREFTTGSQLVSINGHGDIPPTPIGEDILNKNFDTDLAPFVNYTTSGEGAWTIDYSTAKATGYDNTSKTTTAGTYYLVSPAISLANVSEAYVDYDYILRYSKGDDNQQLLISTNFDSANPANGWTVLNNKHTEGSDWNTFANTKVAIPADYMGKTIYLAFRYNTDNVSGSTWEVKDINVKEGNVGPGPTPPGPVGDNLIANGDFETWSGGDATYWKSTTTASTSGALKQSKDAHTGSYSAELLGATAANKRMAYKEITLKAGTYNIHFFAKSTGESSSINPGYVAVVDGKVSGSYVYTDYCDIPASWTEISKSFTLAAQTTVNLVIMNAKNPGVSVLIDDYELTTSDGGIVGGDTPPGPSGDDLWSMDFKTTGSQGDWTIDDKNVGEGLSYVWNFDSKYGMKASAYINNGNVASESWLTSPAINVPAAAKTFSVHHALNFLSGNNRADFVNVMISTDKSSWKELQLASWPAGTNWTFQDDTADFSAYAGKTVYISFQYKSTSSCAPTWEVEKLSIN